MQKTYLVTLFCEGLRLKIKPKEQLNNLMHLLLLGNYIVDKNLKIMKTISFKEL